MSMSTSLAQVATRFPSVSRGILSLSVSGYVPPIHRHWFFNSLAGQLFDEVGFPMWGSPYKLHIPRELRPIYLGYFHFLDHEPLTRRVFANLLRPGSAVIDVGANIGYYTLLAAARVGVKGKVHSVECSRETLAILKENVRRNNLKNVTIYPVAAAKERGELRLNVSAIGLSLLPLHENWPKVSGSGTTVTVPAVPLDELISSPVHAVKIDAEGADLEVLQGMKRILSENQSISVIVEWAPPLLAEAGKDPLELPRWLREAGFTKITVLDETTNKRTSVDAVVDQVRAGNLPPRWVGDLFAQRASNPV